MSKTLISLCSLLLKEHFGEIVQKIAMILLQQGPRPLRMITKDSELPLSKVKKSLCVLLHHNMARFEVSKRGFVEYSVDAERVVLLLRYPYYIYCAKRLYGDSAELLVEELLDNGRMTMSSVIRKVIERLSEATGRAYVTTEAATVKEKFISLVQTRFIQRCPAVKQADDESGIKALAPTLIIAEHELYNIPEVKLHTLINKPKGSGDEEPPLKHCKMEDADKDIYWKINTDRFHQYFRDQNIISAVATRIDKKAAEIVRTILRLSETRTEPWAPQTNSVPRHEILDALIKETNISPKELDPYLAILTDSSMEFLLKSDERGGGMYVVNTLKILQKLAEATAVSVVQDRYGSKCCRIFRLLLMKKYLEQKQIEELAMIPAKDAKDYTYRMMQENFITAHEIPRTPDHAPSRTFFLFHVDINQLSRMLIEHCYKAVYNAMSRRDWEVHEHKRLLEKKQRVDAITATLQQSGADATQIQEVEDMITPPEHAQLKRVKHITEKLEKCEIQLDETIFLLTTWLQSLTK